MKKFYLVCVESLHLEVLEDEWDLAWDTYDELFQYILGQRNSPETRLVESKYAYYLRDHVLICL